MVRCTGGDERWRCTVTDGTRSVDADTASRGGEGAGVRPHDLLEAALASCLNMTVRMEAVERGLDPGDVTTTVELDREDDRTTFVYSVDIEGADERAVEGLRRAAARCPVRRTLSKEIAFEDVGAGTVEGFLTDAGG